MINACGEPHDIWKALFGCPTCRRAKKARNKEALKKKKPHELSESQRRVLRAGLVKDAEWRRNPSIQRQFPNGW